MISNRNILIATIILLCSLIIIQFVWMYRAAVDKETQFEFTVVNALNKAVMELNKDASICLQISSSLNNKVTCCKKGDLGRERWNFIDSIIKSEFSYSKVCIDYEFDLSTVPHPHELVSELESQHKCFTVKSRMRTTKGDSVWLHIAFPTRNKFILAQVGGLFIMSIALILLTIGAFILIYRYYLREQLLARDTRNFINNLTHEFKTPLASIRLANGRIVKATKNDEKLIRYTNIIQQENYKLDEHINYLLDLSMLQKGKMPMNFGVLNVHEQILNQTDSLKLKLEERNGSLEINLNAKVFMANADSFHLSNAFTNILDNACKYSPNAPYISIRSENKNSSIVLSFTDKGLGIEKTDQKTIFQEFSRVNTGNVHNVKGFGLGLTYVAQVVKLHNGQIWLESKPGEGTTFFIELPTVK